MRQELLHLHEYELMRLGHRRSHRLRRASGNHLEHPQPLSAMQEVTKGQTVPPWHLPRPFAQTHIMTRNTNPNDSPAVPASVRAVDDQSRDIADFLREDAEHSAPNAVPHGFYGLVIGAVGVVYGDIGTSPIYAFREALRPVAGDGVDAPEVLGILSILIWTLILIVTVKYVFVLLRADNRGEGGILALYTLVRVAIGHRSLPVLLLAIAGAALFAGDAMITPAISVLSAVEGAGLILPQLAQWVVPATLIILVVLFMAQAKGTAKISALFGPVTVVWFLALAVLGALQIMGHPQVLFAFNPVWAVRFVLNHFEVAFVVMGAIFLAVTGAEALYADLGHFGRKPISAAWLLFVFPALVINYLGQGALVLQDPSALSEPFFHMAPDGLLPALVILATAATVIASQAVITGAYSMARGAIQLGLLPRLRIQHTSGDQSGQIYIGAVNWGLLIGVVMLVLSFKSSSALASAYGIAVTGTMVITTVLGLLYVVNAGLLRVWVAVALVAPIFVLESAFLAANLGKFHDGGYVPVLIATGVGMEMWAWWRGTQDLLARAQKDKIGLDGFVRSMAHSSVHVIPGTGFFLTPDADVVPSALLHNLKHNRVMHAQTVLLTVQTLRVPVADAQDRVSFERLSPQVSRLVLRFGFMETPNVSRALPQARRAGLKFDVMTSTFFLGRRRLVLIGPIGPGRLFDRIFAWLSRLAADPSEYYHLPRNRVVELGERMAI